MTNVLIAAGVMGAMALIFGAVLSIVGRKFAVPENPVRNAVREQLPGANCGGCGYAGCDGYADAVAEGKAPVNKCPVGGDEVARRIGEVMGVTAQAQERMVATVMCRGDVERCATRFEYAGPRDCHSAALAAQGDKACQYSCLGLGDCEKACPFGAIHVNENRLAVVDEDKCHGCGVCVSGCPRGVLQLMPLRHPVHRTCSAMEKGKVVRDNCSAGCLGCGKCERSCKFGALKLVNNLPEINLALCVGCMQCADNCPTGALKSNELLRRHALINYNKCDGCDSCTSACQFDAIKADADGKHVVVEWNCTGCGQCVPRCEKGCIQMVSAARYKN